MLKQTLTLLTFNLTFVVRFLSLFHSLFVSLAFGGKRGKAPENVKYNVPRVFVVLII
jgi:hypothetical protein